MTSANRQNEVARQEDREDKADAPDGSESRPREHGPDNISSEYLDQGTAADLCGKQDQPRCTGHDG